MGHNKIDQQVAANFAAEWVWAADDARREELKGQLVEAMKCHAQEDKSFKPEAFIKLIHVAIEAAQAAIPQE